MLWTKHFARHRLHRAALRYAQNGWSVAPGAFYGDGRYRCGRSSCRVRSPHPAHRDWAHSASCQKTTVANWWATTAFNVILPTGQHFDVIEVPHRLGELALDLSSIGQGPIAINPNGRWQFFVTPGKPLLPGLASRSDIVCHSEFSWVSAPPSRLAQGRVRWLISPQEHGWKMPDSHSVQDVLLQALQRDSLSALYAVAPRMQPSY